jgi:hypothetical protein
MDMEFTLIDPHINVHQQAANANTNINGCTQNQNYKMENGRGETTMIHSNNAPPAEQQIH